MIVIVSERTSILTKQNAKLKSEIAANQHSIFQQNSTSILMQISTESILFILEMKNSTISRAVLQFC